MLVRGWEGCCIFQCLKNRLDQSESELFPKFCRVTVFPKNTPLLDYSNQWHLEEEKTANNNILHYKRYEITKRQLPTPTPNPAPHEVITIQKMAITYQARYKREDKPQQEATCS